MKPLFLRLLHLFMAVVVLLSSMGYGLVEHSCQLRGKRVYSVYSATKVGCQLCSTRPTARAQPTVQATDCCEDNARYDNVDTTSSLSQLLAKFIKAIVETVGAGAVALVTALFDWLFGQSVQVAVSQYAAPPPLSGRALLTFVQTFLI